MMEEIGRVLSEIIAIIIPLGLLLGSLNITGSGLAFASELKAIGGENLALLLILAAAASYILGMGLTITACYVLLATIICPVLTGLGLNLLASHMFVFYLGLSSFITPPVALGSYAAAAIAGGSAVRTGFKSMRLGVIMLLLPFIFILNPSLILQGSPGMIAITLVLVIIGVILIGSALEGYLLRVGRLSLAQRVLIFISGLALLYPHLYLNLGAVGLLAIAVFLRFFMPLLGKKPTESDNID